MVKLALLGLVGQWSGVYLLAQASGSDGVENAFWGAVGASPATAVLAWIVYRQDARIERLMERLVSIAQPLKHTAEGTDELARAIAGLVERTPPPKN